MDRSLIAAVSLSLCGRNAIVAKMPAPVFLYSGKHQPGARERAEAA